MAKFAGFPSALIAAAVICTQPWGGVRASAIDPVEMDFDAVSSGVSSMRTALTALAVPDTDEPSIDGEQEEGETYARPLTAAADAGCERRRRPSIIDDFFARPDLPPDIA